MASTHLKISPEELDRIRATGGSGSSRRRGIMPILGKIGFWLLILVILVYTLFPFYWAIVSSLKTNNEIIRSSPTFWPMEPTLENYRTVLTDASFLRALANSAIISTAVVILSLVFGTLTAYAMARLQFRGRTFFLYTILSMTMFPGIAIIGSLFQMMRRFNAYDTLWGLVVIYMSFALPFTVWVLANFFRAMPPDLEQAAMVDGATPLTALRQILDRLKVRDIPVLLAGMYAPRNLGAAFYEKFDAIYPELAEEYGAGLYPFFLDGVAGDRALNLEDGMHPNAAGVARIVESILPAVEVFLRRVKTST